MARNFRELRRADLRAIAALLQRDPRDALARVREAADMLARRPNPPAEQLVLIRLPSQILPPRQNSPKPPRPNCESCPWRKKKPPPTKRLPEVGDVGGRASMLPGDEERNAWLSAKIHPTCKHCGQRLYSTNTTGVCSKPKCRYLRRKELGIGHRRAA